MSVINNALADIANKDVDTVSKIVRAEITAVKSANNLAWAVGGFTLSLCIGGWAVSQQMTTISTPIAEPLSIPTQDAQLIQPTIVTSMNSSPTSKVIENANISVYVESIATETTKSAPAERTEKRKVSDRTIDSTSLKSVPSPVLIAQVSTPAKQKDIPIKPSMTPVEKESALGAGTMAVEQVELTPLQLANYAIERGKKELDSNNLDGAISEFETALRYQSSDEETRKRLAALYYGKKNLRKSAELLQHGIKLNEGSQILRIALSKILVKENQPEAALSPLIYLPKNVDTDYLAMRAALAQQIKNSVVAFETYQMLVEKEPDNARWWLGLAIQQERKMMYPEAKASYLEATERVGVSKQTQSFIRDRLNILTNLEDASGAN
ncbi:tetratricopeptide repeat protein [Vibrio sp. F74]|uniref:tetratricopeptide repeat protein n=1 Tax=Vibrio sp. F74 TaxID=700020 RepID=UPI0035F5F2BC